MSKRKAFHSMGTACQRCSANIVAYVRPGRNLIKLTTLLAWRLDSSLPRKQSIPAAVQDPNALWRWGTRPRNLHRPDPMRARPDHQNNTSAPFTLGPVACIPPIDRACQRTADAVFGNAPLFSPPEAVGPAWMASEYGDEHVDLVRALKDVGADDQLESEVAVSDQELPRTRARGMAGGHDNRRSVFWTRCEPLHGFTLIELLVVISIIAVYHTCPRR